MKGKLSSSIYEKENSEMMPAKHSEYLSLQPLSVLHCKEPFRKSSTVNRVTFSWMSLLRLLPQIRIRLFFLKQENTNSTSSLLPKV